MRTIKKDSYIVVGGMIFHGLFRAKSTFSYDIQKENFLEIAIYDEDMFFTRTIRNNLKIREFFINYLLDLNLVERVDDAHSICLYNPNRIESWHLEPWLED